MLAQLLPENAYGTYRARLEAFLNIPMDASDQDIHQLIERGFPATALKAMCEVGRVGPAESEQILPSGTFAKRLALGQKLTVVESDLLFRLVHIIALAEALFGDEEKAKRWLCKAKVRLSGKAPMSMLSSLPGTRRVEEMLIQAAAGFTF